MTKRELVEQAAREEEMESRIRFLKLLGFLLGIVVFFGGILLVWHMAFGSATLGDVLHKAGVASIPCYGMYM